MLVVDEVSAGTTGAMDLPRLVHKTRLVLRSFQHRTRVDDACHDGRGTMPRHRRAGLNYPGDLMTQKLKRKQYNSPSLPDGDASVASLRPALFSFYRLM